MKSITVVRKELLPKYRSQDWWWRKVFIKAARFYARIGWKHAPLISYPLMIDIEFGLMRYYFYKDGWIGVKDRITSFNIVLAEKLKGHDDLDLNPDEYHEIRTLTDPDEILNYELNELLKEDY